MEEAVDGDYQAYKANDGGFVREHFFGAYPELAEMVADMSDDDIWRLKRGGHDPEKVYAAYAAAAKHTGQPTVILAKTVKGYGMGDSGEGQNPAHNQKSVADEALRQFRDRFNIPISDEQLDDLPFYKPSEDSAVLRYVRERREALGGYIPTRKNEAEPLDTPELSAFSSILEGSGDRELSTTMGFVRILMQLTRNKAFSERLVPIVADEARTFGMEGMFRQIGIYAPTGQLYTPVDADQLAYYREDVHGQILQEGISEAGSLSSLDRGGNLVHQPRDHMIPFFIFYSMFGFQRVGDLIWQAADQGARGFLLGGTSGRTTLNGEGLQHQDGHSHLMAATVPSCQAYDPTFIYELAVIMQDGMRRMYKENENIFYYITTMNENYVHPAMPEGAEEGIRRGMYLFSEAKAKKGAHRVQLLGSGTILLEVIAAARCWPKSGALLPTFGAFRASTSCAATAWRPSGGIVSIRRRDGRRRATSRSASKDATARSSPRPDYMRSFPDQVRPWIPGRFTALGTDGFGRSDTREALRSFFEIDRRYVVAAALHALAEEGVIKKSVVKQAIEKYDIDPDAAEPWTV